MSMKKIYTSENLSALYMLQSIAIAFFAAGTLLAYKLGSAPTTDNALTSHSTHITWSFVLAAVAALAPLAVCIYASRVIAHIAVSGDGSSVFIKSALFGAKAKTWAAKDLQVLATTEGDTKGEQSFAVPRATLLAESGGHSRRYLLAVKNAEHLRALRTVIAE